LRPPIGVTAALPQNRLLRALPAADLERLWPRLDRMELRANTTVQTAEAPMEGLLFLEAGTVSMIATFEDGSRIEVGMVGCEGVVGLPLVFGATSSALEGLVQMEGRALRLPAGGLRAALADMPALMPLLLRYADSFLFQVAQAGACNGKHPIEQRLARWLLMEHDRSDGDSFVMTQEFMAIMLGVRRPGVTLAIGALQRAGLVVHGRGHLRVVNRAGLEAAACECYGLIRRRFAWLVDEG
jgi:CRP-like cAMP-binding protein